MTDEALSAVAARGSRRLGRWPSLTTLELAERLDERRARALGGPRALAREVAARFETAADGPVAPLPLVVAAQRPPRLPEPAEPPARARPDVSQPAEDGVPHVVPARRVVAAAQAAPQVFAASPAPSRQRAAGRPGAAPDQPAAPPVGPRPQAAAAVAAAAVRAGTPAVGAPPPPAGLADSVLRRTRVAIGGSALAEGAARSERWSPPTLHRAAPPGRRVPAAPLPLPVGPYAGRPAPSGSRGSPPPAAVAAPAAQLLVVTAAPAPPRSSGRLELLPPAPPVPVRAAPAPPSPTAPALALVVRPPHATPASRPVIAEPAAARAPAAAAELVLAANPAAAAATGPSVAVAPPPGAPGIELPTVELPAPDAPGRTLPADPRRLADQIYELIVHRLTHERARRGW